jgi:GNAT superfamily N-acetyltransferase
MSVGVVLDRCIMSQIEVFKWEQVNVFKISPDHFGGETLSHMLRELYDANSGFLHNASVLFECFATGRLYGLLLEETEDMFRYEGHHPMFMQSRPPWTLPAFCCLSETGAVEMIWVHPRARRRGFASAFVHQLDVTQATVILPESKGFWDKHPQVQYSRICDLAERNAEPTCNHWALTGFPLLDEPYRDVLQGVLKHELDPALTCAVCAKKRTSTKRKKI